MAKQTINQGTAPTGAGGDTFRSGSAKLQANDNELYDFIGGAANTTTLPSALPLTKGGTGATTAAAARTNLGLTTTTSNTDSTAGRILKVGDLGFGARPRRLTAAHDGTTQIYTTNGTPPPGQGSVWASNLFIASDTVAGDGNYFSFEVSNGLIRSGGVRGGLPLPERTVRDTGNTTVDGNGFIKAASPIVKLFADKIELNDEAQRQNVEFEKLGVGNYLIKGSTGFSQDGWYIETPKDANGNLLVAAVYEQLENGDISVKTYDYMLNKKGRIVADTETPLDIPEGRWIDIRLQELPPIEFEMPTSKTPAEFQPTGIAQAVSEMKNGTEQ